MINDIYSKIQNLSVIATLLLNNKQPNEAKTHIDEAYKLLINSKIKDFALYTTAVVT
jgi:hypothetical protein